MVRTYVVRARDHIHADTCGWLRNCNAMHGSLAVVHTTSPHTCDRSPVRARYGSPLPRTLLGTVQWASSSSTLTLGMNECTHICMMPEPASVCRVTNHPEFLVTLLRVRVRGIDRCVTI